MKNTLHLIIFFFTITVNAFANESTKSIPLDIQHGLPLATVIMNNQKCQLILDLGSESSSLSKALTEKISPAILDNAVRSLDVYGNQSINTAFKVTNVQIGEYQLDSLEFAKISAIPSEESKDPEILTNGKIGRTPFLNKVLFIDRKNKVCLVKDGRAGESVNPVEFSEGKWITADFKLDNAGISLKVLIDSKEERELILDTGANISLLHNQSTKKKQIDLRNETVNASMRLKNGTPLGEFSFYPFDFSKVGLQGIIGFDFFDRYLVCLDFVNQKVFFKPY